MDDTQVIYDQETQEETQEETQTQVDMETPDSFLINFELVGDSASDDEKTEEEENTQCVRETQYCLNQPTDETFPPILIAYNPSPP